VSSRPRVVSLNTLHSAGHLLLLLYVILIGARILVTCHTAD